MAYTARPNQGFGHLKSRPCHHMYVESRFCRVLPWIATISAFLLKSLYAFKSHRIIGKYAKNAPKLLSKYLQNFCTNQACAVPARQADTAAIQASNSQIFAGCHFKLAGYKIRTINSIHPRQS
jgi:hypothetical protein